ncbi:MAG: AraC family transcriptional regulator [Firmicutes bacterium]|nr:AraC family transcriptional regulator [Bacillota bacterium]
MGQRTLVEAAKQTAEMYAIACQVGCKVVDSQGELIASFGDDKGHSLCELLAGSKATLDSCRQAYLYGGYQAEKLGEYYIYFCPAGLCIWAVPIVERGVAVYYLIGGPVLLHEIDDLLLTDIYRSNPKNSLDEGEVRQRLAQLSVVGPTRTRCLAEVLFGLAQSLMRKDLSLLEQRRSFQALGAGIGEVIHDNKLDPNVTDGYVFGLESDLIFAVKTGNQKQARKILNEILGALYFEDTSFAVKKSRLIALTAILARAAITAGADLDVIFGLENSYLLQIQDEDDLLELSRLLVPLLERFIACTFELRNVKNRDLIYQAISYIRQNYNGDLPLEDVAEQVGLTPTYFSKLFGEEMGMAFTDYLNRVRIEAAKLLMQEDLSLAEISLRVGFNDQSYFSKVFRKFEGLSPLKWRRKTYA